ncbi:MAG TPA: hypothetical protein VNW92_00650 [Polyangiaceae bacterium]|jgi:hypothetical protein|nr:hypothetical protein [Polyangiaceae bacterium]
MSRNSLAILIAGSSLLVVSAAHAQANDKPQAESEEPPAAHRDSDDEATPKADDKAKPKADEQRAKQVTPPIVEPTREATPPAPVNPWFVRPPLMVTAGAHDDWKLTIYGFAEADMMRDSTRSFNDGLNNGVIAHEQTQAHDQPRLQFTIRNSRLGFKAEAPSAGGIRSTGVLEFDLFGNQPTINGGGGSPGTAPGAGTTTEGAYFNNAAFRVRHAYVKLEDDVVDVLAGQTYHLLGWQNYFFGSTCGFLGMPNQLFNRTTQVRLSHTFASDAVSLDITAAALRPAQRDSGLPDAEGGVRLAINHWKGMTTPGSGGTGALAAAIGVSGLVRWFRVDPYAPLPAPPIPLTGWALAGNILLPVIPVADSTDRGNALTLTGEFVMGTGDADQYTGMTAGATMPNAYPLPPDTPTNFAGVAIPQQAVGAMPLVGLPYTPNIDPGLVAFDYNGFLHTINWQTFIVGIQYYLPPSGRIFITGNYSWAKSNNIASLYHPDSPRQPWVNSLSVFDASWYADGNIFFDITPAIRMGLSYQHVSQELADGTHVRNERFESTFLYFL